MAIAMWAGLPLDTAPMGLVGVGDATWMASPERMGIIVTAFGGAVHVEVKLLKGVGDSSQYNESLATARVRQMLLYGREYFRCSGLGCDGPSMLLTDNTANMSLATHAGTPHCAAQQR